MNPTKETLIRLGEITMDKKVVQMQEVTVLAPNRINTEDKIMAFPTREQLRHSYDGYSALRALMFRGWKLTLEVQLSLIIEKTYYCVLTDVRQHGKKCRI